MFLFFWDHGATPRIGDHEGRHIAMLAEKGLA